jgi:hypothetical protein
MYVLSDSLRDLTSSHSEFIVRIYPKNNEAKKPQKHFFLTVFKTSVDFGLFVPAQTINN